MTGRLARPRSLAGAALAAALAVPAGGCRGGGELEPTGRTEPVTPAALAALAATAVDLEDPQLGRAKVSGEPRCPGYRRVHAQLVADGEVNLSLDLGECRHDDIVDWVCDRRAAPRSLSRPGELQDCSTRRLADGSELVTGSHAGHEDPRYLFVVRRTDGLQYTVATQEGEGGWEVDDLVEIASDLRVRPRVDAAYGEAGQRLEHQDDR